MTSVASINALPKQQVNNAHRQNVCSINFKKSSRDEYTPQRGYQYVSPEELAWQKEIDKQRKEQNRRKKLGTFATVASIVVSTLFVIALGGQIKDRRATKKAAEEALKAAQEAAKKSGNDLKTEKVDSLGKFIKFENVVDDPLVADFSETKTLSTDIKKMLTDMMNDSKIEEKYINAAGLEHKPFPNAAILTGPTGTGKTECIRMYAKKTNANFSVIKLTDFSNSYIDGTAGNMSKMFEDIERLLKENPEKEFVFLFDEADGIAKKLENISGDHNHLNVNRQTFLIGIEKIQKYKNCKCFAATNVNIDELDKAVVNRFGKNIDFKLPTKTQIIEALKFHLKDSKNLQKDNFDFFKNQSGEIDRFAQDMVNKKSSFRDLAKVTTDAQARHCRAMSNAQDENMRFDIKYLIEALKSKGKNANELK